MKDFIVLTVAIFTMIISLYQFNFFEKTRTGERVEHFRTLNSQTLPYILANYLADKHAKYRLYRIPKYMDDFFKNNNDFSSVYKFQDKYSIIILSPVKNSNPEFDQFNNQLVKELKKYPDNFNVIFQYQNLDKEVYLNTYDNKAYKDLLEYCNYFCLIDPQRNTLFTYQKYSITEVESIGVLLQQYSFLK